MTQNTTQTQTQQNHVEESGVEPESPGIWTRTKQWFGENLPMILSTSIAVGVLIVGVTGQIDLPAWVVPVSTGYLFVSIPGYFAAAKIVDWLYSPNWVPVQEIDAERMIARPYAIPPDMWREKTMESGEPFQLRDGSWVVRRLEYDPDTGLTATGADLGELNDVELMTWNKAVQANRGKLRTWARIGQGLYSKLPAIAQAIESAYWRQQADDTLDRTATHPEVVQSNVVEDIEAMTDSIELPDQSAEEMLEDAAEDAVGEEIPEEWDKDTGDVNAE